MGFWPYLRHAHTSDDELSAGTWQTTFLTWFFLVSMERDNVSSNSQKSATRMTKHGIKKGKEDHF